MGTYWSSSSSEKTEIKVAQPWFDQIVSGDLHYYVIPGDISLRIGQDIILHCNVEKINMKIVAISKHPSIEDAIDVYRPTTLWPKLLRHKKALDRNYGNNEVTVIQI